MGLSAAVGGLGYVLLVLRPGAGAGGLVGAGRDRAVRLIEAGKALAVLDGRYNVSCEDIQKLAAPIMRHRILKTFHAESDGITSDEIVRRLIQTVPVPKSGL